MSEATIIKRLREYQEKYYPFTLADINEDRSLLPGQVIDLEFVNRAQHTNDNKEVEEIKNECGAR